MKDYKGAELPASQCHIVQQAGTEPPFDNAYWDNHLEGIYVDVLTGQPLFTSEHKFDSGSGWPSFTKPIAPELVAQKSDSGHGMERVEVLSKKSGAHLGHVFDDGPADQGGLRYCINSAALDFIPRDQMEARGYGALLTKKI